jgi:hypothetical protein
VLGKHEATDLLGMLRLKFRILQSDSRGQCHQACIFRRCLQVKIPCLLEFFVKQGCLIPRIPCLVPSTADLRRKRRLRNNDMLGLASRAFPDGRSPQEARALA